MTRVEMTDSLQDAIYKLSEGNPGAVNVCAQLVKHGASIDPDDAFGGAGKLLSLDTLEIYGPRIWMLYKDVCDHDIVATAALLRGTQLGILDEGALHHAIDNRGSGVSVESILEQVRERLPNFSDGSGSSEGAAEAQNGSRPT